MSMFYELMMKKKGMPSRYQEVEYIESDGNAYIDTGLILGSNFEIEAEFISVGTGTDKPVFSSRVSGGNNEITLFTSYDKFQLKFGSSNTYVSGYSSDTKYNVKTDGQNWYIDGNLVQTFANTTTLTQPLYISAVKNEGATSPNFVGKHKIQLFKVKKNGSLIRNFIPVYDTETQKYGMWESVQGKFYGNDGTGDFAGSIVGYTVVGSPTIVDGVVSGFSSSNYLTISQSSGTVNSIEITIQVQDIASTITHTGLIIGLNGNLNSRLAIGTNGRVQCNYRDIDNTTRYLSSSKQVSEYNYMRVKFNTNGASLDLSTDGITWINEYTRTEIPNLENAFIICPMGYISNTYNSFEGGINMPKTSIKLNNKLWFNGQEG